MSAAERDLDEVFEQLYPQLRAMAASWWYREPSDHSLSPTAIVHEAYLALNASPPDMDQGRAYFFGAAVRAMRRALVSHARQRSRRIIKTQQDLQRVDVTGTGRFASAFEIAEALEVLEHEYPRSARVAELRIFTDMSTACIAGLLGVSSRTVLLDWRFARASLHRILAGESWATNSTSVRSSSA